MNLRGAAPSQVSLSSRAIAPASTGLSIIAYMAGKNLRGLRPNHCNGDRFPGSRGCRHGVPELNPGMTRPSKRVRLPVSWTRFSWDVENAPYFHILANRL